MTHRENFLSFDFAALDYNNPNGNEYAFRMVGVDEDWVYAGTRRHADYPTLRPGDYIFHVKGSNSDGVGADRHRSVTRHAGDDRAADLAGGQPDQVESAAGAALLPASARMSVRAMAMISAAGTPFRGR